jgi:hypothetical protein
MNLQLANTEEYVDGSFTGNLGEVLIRCEAMKRREEGRREGTKRREQLWCSVEGQENKGRREGTTKIESNQRVQHQQ